MQQSQISLENSPLEQHKFKAVFFDGKTALAQLVRVTVEKDKLLVVNSKTEMADKVSLDHLLRPITTSDQIVLAVEGPQNDRRITIEKVNVPTDVWTYLKTLPEARRQSPGHPLRIILASVLFILACLATFTILIPLASDRLALIVPRSIEQTLGDRLERTVLQVGPQNICGSSSDNPHLGLLAKRLQTASSSTEPVSLHIIDLPVANAFALPSGRIFITRPLLDLSQNSDELISILAHEMGHVRAHHAMRLSLRVGGSSAMLGFLLGDFTGSAAIIAIGQILMGTAFSREFEREADEMAVQILQDLGVSPLVLANMLERLQGDDQQVGLLATHPLTADRRAFLTQAALAWDKTTQRPEAEKLSIQSWDSLKLICD
ncbi:M48 family metallopeptidase [Pararhizobium sp. IMCC21322]|uniref:M48 family metallopeptidase n=1 Tax=Pararhizobium sp. IMCC21322 TaxID=3067903 RepID=UPI002741D9AC|nr:M48 family metallopeptidase [Pararhizobium sp. IMCC21322]